MAALPTPITVKTDSGSTKIIVGAVALTGLYFFVAKPYLDKLKLQGDLNTDQGSTVKPAAGKKMFDLNGKPIASANLATIVYDIYNGLHPGWYKPTDDARVIRAFKNTPFGYVAKVEQMYLAKYGENLRSTMADKLSDQNWIQVKYWFK